MTATLYTVGHSNLAYEDFLKLIRSFGVTAIADVRSSPFSRHYPHFNSDALKAELSNDKISYVSLGNELGGRPKDDSFFCDGVADYEKMARAPSFESGIKRVIEGQKRFRIALMCSEHNPLDCHRCLLVGRAFFDRDFAVHHILSNGTFKDQKQIEQDLLEMARQNRADFFPDDQISSAYRDRAMKVAFSRVANSLTAESDAVEKRRA